MHNLPSHDPTQVHQRGQYIAPSIRALVQDLLAHARELPATSTHTQKLCSSPHHLLGPTTHLLLVD
jgi:hypothetical protein